jgi:serine/threonine-protein kinase
MDSVKPRNSDAVTRLEPLDSPSASIAPGTILANKYRVERVLGGGGMGIVVAATHIQLFQRVALKFLTRAAMTNAEAVERFMREAQAAARIQSEHVVKVLDVGTLESGVPYIVMEYVEGKDLSQILAERGPLPIAEATETIVQACVALADAHVAGIVHRDLKPSNIFVTRRSDGKAIVKVFDFGISKITPKAESADMMLTGDASSMGTPFYMSPEQMTSARDVDQRSDVWALGMVLHELLTGQPAFVADNLPELCAKILSSIPAPPVSLSAPSVPARLDAVIQRALEKKPENRYANVAQLAQALAPFASPAAKPFVDRTVRIFRTSGTFIPSMLPGPLTYPPPKISDKTPTPVANDMDPLAPFLKGRRRLFLGALALLGALVCLGLVGLVRGQLRAADPPPVVVRELSSRGPAAVAPSATVPYVEPPVIASPPPSAPPPPSAAPVVVPPVLRPVATEVRRQPPKPTATVAPAPKPVLPPAPATTPAVEPGYGGRK